MPIISKITKDEGKGSKFTSMVSGTKGRAFESPIARQYSCRCLVSREKLGGKMANVF